MTLQTPHLLPVVNFYCGGTRNSLYGGGIFRTIKEFLSSHPETVHGRDYSEFFKGVMSSVAALTDFNITQERYLDYLGTPIRDRVEFSDFDGGLFVDSGGYKILQKGGLSGSNFDLNVSQKAVYGIQRAFGGDILVNLDSPLSPNDDYETRVQKTEQTAEYVREFLALTTREESRYLTIHGHNRTMIDRFLTTVEHTLNRPLKGTFDGFALGSLVPYKDDMGTLIEAVTAAKKELADRDLGDLPLHVFGISGRVLPLLVALGVDSFDSASYLHAAINGKYSTSLFDTVPLSQAIFDDCHCPVCETEALRSDMRGNTRYQKDVLGPVAVHNLAVQQFELKKIREVLQTGDQDRFRSYLEEMYRDRPASRKFAYRTINKTLEPYF